MNSFFILKKIIIFLTNFRHSLNQNKYNLIKFASKSLIKKSQKLFYLLTNFKIFKPRKVKLEQESTFLEPFSSIWSQR